MIDYGAELMDVFGFMRCRGFVIDDIGWWDEWQLSYEAGVVYNRWGELDRGEYVVRAGVVMDYASYVGLWKRCREVKADGVSDDGYYYRGESRGGEDYY